jgi:hypothetical protein
MKYGKITRNEWRSIREMAVNMAKATAQEGNETLVNKERVKLLRIISRLEKKYGRTSDLLATRADYVSNDRLRISLWLEAYRLARRNVDKANIVLICSSLADYYIAEALDIKNGTRWLLRFKDSLREAPDRAERRIFKTLGKKLSELKSASNRSGKYTAGRETSCVSQ